MKKFIFMALCIILPFNNISANNEVTLEIITPKEGQYLAVNDSITFSWVQTGLDKLMLEAQICWHDDMQSLSAVKEIHCAGNSDITNGLIDVDTNASNNSFEWQLPKMFKSGLYKIWAKGYANTGTSDSVYLEDKMNQYVIIDKGDQNFSLINSTSLNNISQNKVIVDIGTNKLYANASRYFVRWKTPCNGQYANVWLVAEVLQDGTEIVIPMTFYEWHYETNKLNLDVFNNKNIYYGLIPGSGSTDKTQHHQLPSDPSSGKFNFAQILIKRSPAGEYYTERVSSNLYTKGKEHYKIRVDVHGNNCSATGLSRYIYPTAVLDEPIPSLPLDNVVNDSPETTTISDNNNTSPKLVAKKATIDKTLSNRLKGKLLLQVQNRGRIWYVNPGDARRHEVTFANALPLFEKLSLGITDADLDKIPMHNDNWTSSIGDRLKGKILLQVQDRGRIWYVDFNGKKWEVTWKNLMTLFESLALGITDSDLDKIQMEGL